MSPKSSVHGGVTDATQSARTGRTEEELEAEIAPPAPETVPRPARDDAKAAWVIYAVSLGWSREDATAATKQELIDGTKPEQEPAPGE